MRSITLTDGIDAMYRALVLLLLVLPAGAAEPTAKSEPNGKAAGLEGTAVAGCGPLRYTDASIKNCCGVLTYASKSL